MRTLLPKLLLSLTLITTSTLPITTTAQSSHAHHQSGVSGQVVGLPTVAAGCTIRVLSSNGRFVTEVSTDAQFNFEIGLKPGIYTLQPFPFTASPNLIIPPGVPIAVKVEKKTFTELTLTYTPLPI